MSEPSERVFGSNGIEGRRHETGATEVQQSKVGRILLALALSLTLLTFFGTLRFEFVYDDLTQIVSNPQVHSWHYVSNYFTENVWAPFYHGPGRYYRPLFLLWLFLNYISFGLWPGGWHATTLLAHLLVTGLVYLVAYRLTRRRIVAGMASLFFGLHPAHVEAVAWVSAVCEPLMTAGTLASLLCYLKQRETQESTRRRAWQAASLVLFLVALLIKETALVVPGIIAAYEWLFPAGDGSRDLKATSLPLRIVRAVDPFVLVAAGYLAVRVHALKGLGSANEKPLAIVLLTWPSLLWFYLKQLLWPVKISPFDDTPWVHFPGLHNFVLPLVGVSCAIAGLVFWARKSRVVAFSAAWLAFTILPALWGVHYFGWNELAHARYLYLPSVAFALLLAVAVRKLPGGRARLFRGLTAQVTAVAVMTCFFVAASAKQSVYWTNDFVLYSRGVQVAPDNPLAWGLLGTEWEDRHRPDKAIELYQHALDLAPDDWNVNFVLGVAYSKVGNFPEAERYLVRSCQHRCDFPEVHFYLGWVRLQLGKLKEAENGLRKALEIAPAPHLAWHQTLGTVLEREGDLAGACDEFRAELAINPASYAKQQLEEVQARLRATGPAMPPSSLPQTR